MKKAIFTVLFLLCMFTLISSSPYKYSFSFDMVNKNHMQFTVYYKIHTQRPGYMPYYKSKENFLDLSDFDSIDNTDPFFCKKIVRSKDSGRVMFWIRHATLDFYNIKSIEKVKYMLDFMVFELDDKFYRLKIEKLDENSNEMYKSHFERIQSYNIVFDLDFLEKYCTQVESVDEVRSLFPVEATTVEEK